MDIIAEPKLIATAKMVQDENETNKELDLDSVEILLVGDPGVGKTSLIYSLVNDEFEPQLPDKMATLTIPAEVTSENVPLRIVDYSEKQQTQEDLRKAILSSNVICLVYVAGDEDSLKRVARHWIPTLRKYQSETTATTDYKPLVLVANKIDLVTEGKTIDQVTSIIQEFAEIEAYLEVSASLQKNVIELFSTAQKAVIYPLPPLYDPQLRVLTKECRNALVKIFKLCDLDGDGLLSDHELNLFQENCFEIPLQKDSLDDLKSIIKQSIMDGIVNDSLTLTGFLFLHTLTLDKGRHEFTWQVLRKFNYDNQLKGKSSEVSNGEIDVNFGSGSSLSSSVDVDYRPDYYDDEDELTAHVDLRWIRENANVIKAGLGITIVTLLSMLALKYLVHGGNRSSI